MRLGRALQAKPLIVGALIGAAAMVLLGRTTIKSRAGQGAATGLAVQFGLRLFGLS